jgi:hypothetical protein
MVLRWPASVTFSAEMTMMEEVEMEVEVEGEVEVEVEQLRQVSTLPPLLRFHQSHQCQCYIIFVLVLPFRHP